MRLLVLLLFVSYSPVMAAGYTPRPERSSPLAEALVQLAQRQHTCCKRCNQGDNQKACGDYCISATAKCNLPTGCAC